ncbi:purine and uridine phosphorylase [Aspergillus pseudoustus]|uniref:Purine and uridine phosphorylase n=1 Tax=Aspergillus pseudoustus TaxID=1810923 RepID=A0ABR4ISI2_9EURO
MRPRSRNEFEIAIICALPLGFGAVEALFDETYDISGVAAYRKHPGDANWYRTGRIGRHNVVLTCVPEMGKRGAADVASSIQVSFPRANLALLVGICGGVPFPSEQSEIILGDVIISDKVVEYDFGRQYSDGFRPKYAARDIVGNRAIRSFLSGLKTRQMHEQLHGDLWEYQQTLQGHSDGRWQYPGAPQDQLFQPFYRHKHYHRHFDLGCMGSLIPRTRLGADSPKPYVHFGSLASGDTFMKSGEHRDGLTETGMVIGFEMEGAGVLDSLPCVIIKGVCDYADSHKNKTWQNYAAATAASCTKVFLGYWVPSLSNGPAMLPTAYDTSQKDAYE